MSTTHSNSHVQAEPLPLSDTPVISHRPLLAALVVACTLMVQGCDSSNAETRSEPVRLNGLHEATWSASYSFGETTYDIDYTLFLDLQEPLDDAEALLTLSLAERSLRRSTSYLRLIETNGSDEYSFDPAQSSGTRRPGTSGTDSVEFEGVLIRSPGIPASTVRFRGTQAAGASSVTGVVTCEPVLRGCDRATVTLTPSQD